MVAKLQEFKLGELCSLITDGKHGDCENEASSGYYFLSVKDIFDNRLVYENARQIKESDFLETHRRTNLEPGDVLFTNTGTIGRLAIAPQDPKTYRTTFQKSVAILKPKHDMIFPRYLYYLLHGDNSRLSEFAAGTTQKNLLLKDMRNFNVQIHPLEAQRAIAHILGTLDDKIELNRRMNETLEGMARAVFKSWFIDFDPVIDNALRAGNPIPESMRERAEVRRRGEGGIDEINALFPNEFQDSTMGRIPKGWEVFGLNETGTFLNGLALQKYPPGDGDSLPVIKIAQLNKGNTEGADKASAEIDAAYIVEDGDVLFSWSGSLACVLWTGGRGALNQHLFKVTSERFSKWFYYLWIHEHLPEFRHIAAGKATTMGHIQRHHLEEAKVIVPSPPLLARMETIIAPLIEASVSRMLENRTLATLRDVLLPKLLSGEIRVKDAERFLGDKS